ncbi:glycoside hydrolase family 25 protein [Streptomyces sp. Ag109_O5-1]|uniref:glycoside hydrolase family 25 protein n=1 Tax=Streptomyces sp. Ag109_O5-1 TaxID=1938851 RepID=UPI0021A4F520|nr:glycoside hydrolase family 25 protein [Streptomyces sp. Ag109_O5-1]
MDVADYQSATFSTSGLDFVFVKATEGLSYTNPLLAAQTRRGRDAGLVVGFYHYPHMANSPQAEADYFLSKAPIQAGDIIGFDWEGYDTANQNVPKSRQLAYRDAWLSYVKDKLPTHRVGMYCNTDYWLNVDKTSTCGDFLWIATGGLPAGQPGIKHPWTFHQYSTAGGIDHDVANFTDRAALTAWARGLIEEDPMAGITKQDIADACWRTDDIAAGSTEAHPQANPTWVAETYLKGTFENTVKLLAQEAAQAAAIAKLASLVGSGVDTATVVAAVQTAIADAVVKVSVDVTGPQG